KDLPVGVHYILGLWGCVLVTLGFGYTVAATNPLRHLVWAQMGIARGLVTFQQAGVGIIVAGLVTVAYLACYPRSTAGVPQPKSRLCLSEIFTASPAGRKRIAHRFIGG